jgi:hypothetical protein
MSIQLSVAVRNALLDAIEAAIGSSAVLKLWAGTLPANCAASDTGTEVAALSLPADWMANASGGAKVLSGTWSESAADNAGTVAYFRIYASDSATCHLQGTVTAAGGGGDLTLDNVVVAAGEPISITGFTLTAPNA